jgi:hypothetical protein
MLLDGSGCDFALIEIVELPTHHDLLGKLYQPIRNFDLNFNCALLSKREHYVILRGRIDRSA